MANLKYTFLQTAASPTFNKSLFHEILFNFHDLNDTSFPNPGYTPYYNENFFTIIKESSKDDCKALIPDLSGEKCYNEGN